MGEAQRRSPRHGGSRWRVRRAMVAAVVMVVVVSCAGAAAVAGGRSGGAAGQSGAAAWQAWHGAAPLLSRVPGGVAAGTAGRRGAAARGEAPAGSGPLGFIDERGAGASGPSRAKTILLSALVPGLGQLRWGAKTSGVSFLLAEAASWTAFLTFRSQGDGRRDRYVEYAGRFAGVEQAGGQSNRYYQSLARYDRSDPGPGSYNEIEVRLVAKRELFPDDPEAQQRYIEENSISGERAWNWESAARRQEYAEIRSSSESAYHRSDFAVGGLIAGRILSVMHAILLTADRSEEPSEHGGERLDGKLAPGLVRSVQPYMSTDLFDGAYRLGLRARF